MTEKSMTPFQLVLRRFVKNRLAICGFVILLVMFLFSFIGVYVSPYGEYELFFCRDGIELDNNDDIDYNEPGTVIYKRAPPSAAHWLGTDRDGRDVLTRLMYGGRISLLIGFAVIIIELVIGVALGGIAGYYGGFIDGCIMRLVDVWNCIPQFPILLMLSSIMLAIKVPQQHRIYYLMFVIGFLSWPGIARIVRGQILSLREQEFMLAAEAMGLSVSRKIFHHLLPNVVPQLIVIATLNIGSVILLEAALSYLGMGLAFPYASWGNMVNAVNDPLVMRSCLYIWLPPGLCILFTVLGFNFVGDGLRDACDPRIGRSRM